MWVRCTRWVRSRCRQIPNYNAFLQVATCVGQVHHVGQEQVQIDLLLHYSPAGGNLCGPGAPGEGADRSPITLFTCRWQPVWGRCTRWARSRCRRTTCRLSSTSPASPSGSPPAESPSRYIACMPVQCTFCFSYPSLRLFSFLILFSVCFILASIFAHN